MKTKLMKRIVSVEYLVAAILVAVFYLNVGGFKWYWLPISFFVFDISAIGYLVNKRVGALTYNLVHSLIAPFILVGVYILTLNQAVLFVTLLWLFHVFVDRALGYGMKHVEGFHHTHLGPVGKAKKK